MTDRHSFTEEQELITDPAELALAEARNALRQFDVGMLMLEHWLDQPGQPIRLRPSDLLSLNRFALDGIHKFAGTFRTSEIKISGSAHQPPPPDAVPALLEDFCDYANANWSTKSAIHLAAYALWRVNWIHPFVDGNGRTARIISYMLLCAKLGYKLPGSQTIPEQISADKNPYYRALEEADIAFNKGNIDLAAMETLLQEQLASQLLGIHQDATDAGLQRTKEDAHDISETDISKFEIAILPMIMRTVPVEENKSHLVMIIERNPVLSPVSSHLLRQSLAR